MTYEEVLKKTSAEKLVKLLLKQPWQQKVEFIPEYMPPYPRTLTEPKFVVRYNDGSEYPPFLRYSHGPVQGFFWDVYGDDFQALEWAVLAVHQAPAPVYVGPTVFRIPLPSKEK